jgi:phenylacetate-CoA ligase
MIYDPAKECMSAPEIEQLQVERLQATLFRARANVGFYKQALDPAKLDIEKIRGLSDLRRLPFTTKEDLRRTYPYGMFAVPLHDVLRIHSTSGTSGKPIVTGYTRNDLETWKRLVARVLSAAEVNERDFTQISFHYGQSSAGMGFNAGAEALGASVIPSSGESLGRQIMMMRDYRTSVLISTPSWALHLACAIEEQGIALGELNLRVGIFGAEPWSEKMRAEIETRLGLKAFDNYGLTELIGPGVSFECELHEGLHVNEDHFIMEIVDPDSLEPVKPGDPGELAFTSITREACPLIRYRTGDIARLIPGHCACGRTTVRMSRLTGRTDDMIIVEGVNVFPSQIEQAILGIEGIRPYYQIALDRAVDGGETISVRVEASPDFPFLDEMGRVEGLKDKLERRLLDDLGLRVSVSLVEPKSLGSPDGKKFSRVVDKRQK